MGLTVSLCVHLLIMIGCLLLDMLGIYCLRHRKQCTETQRALLLNLAVTVTVKPLYDYIPLTLQKMFKSWYAHSKIFKTNNVEFLSGIFRVFGPTIL